MHLLLEDITLNQLKNSGISSTTSKYADERFGLMGSEATQLVEATYKPEKDYILCKFLTEATEKYPDDHTFQDVNHQDFSLDIDPSKTYEMWIMFYPIRSKLREKNLDISQDTIRSILPECYVKVWSNSPSFHYQGFNYNLSQQDASLFPTNIRPQKWDKIHGHALIDKHLYLTLNDISRYFNEIAQQVINSIPQESAPMTEAKVEITQKHRAVFSIGRMNPYTKGHEKLIDKLIATALAIKGEAFLFVTHTQDQKKNPLSWEQKVNFIRQATAGKQIKVCDDPDVISAFDAANWLYNHQYTDIVAIFGSDRVPEMKAMYNKYNGKDTTRGFYEFNTIQVVSAGDRDPDAEGVEGYSATKARNAAVDNDFNTFYKIVGTTNQNLAQAMFNAVRQGMGLNEKKIRERANPELFNKIVPTLLKKGLEANPKAPPSPTKSNILLYDPDNQRGETAKMWAAALAKKGWKVDLGKGGNSGNTPMISIENGTLNLLFKNKRDLAKSSDSAESAEGKHLTHIQDIFKKTYKENGPFSLIVGSHRLRNVKSILKVDKPEGASLPKADFVIIDEANNPILYISHKDGKKATDFQQYGGLQGLEDNPDVKKFARALKRKFPDGEMAPSGRVSMALTDELLIMKAVYGLDYGSNFGANHVQVVIQGEMNLEPKGKGFNLTCVHLMESGESPEGDFEPMLVATFRNGRNQVLHNCRIGIYTKAYASIGSKRGKKA